MDLSHPNALIKNPLRELSDNALDVYHYLVTEDEDKFIPTIKGIADVIGIEIEKVLEALNQLEEKGLISYDN